MSPKYQMPSATATKIPLAVIFVLDGYFDVRYGCFCNRNIHEEHTVTAQTAIHTDRTLLPRGLIARRTVRSYRIHWKFEFGAVVEFADMLAVVAERSLTALGHQTFTLHIIGESHGRPIRVVRAEYIRNAPTLKVVGIYTSLVHDEVQGSSISPAQAL